MDLRGVWSASFSSCYVYIAGWKNPAFQLKKRWKIPVAMLHSSPDCNGSVASFYLATDGLKDNQLSSICLWDVFLFEIMV